MKIVRLNGGLGNQMFQYAFAKSLMRRFPDEQVLFDYAAFKVISPHNGLEIDRLFGLSLPQAGFTDVIKTTWPKSSRIWFKMEFFFPRHRKVVNEKNFDSLIASGQRNLYFDGFWQNEKYFCNALQEVRDAFTFAINSKGTKNLGMASIIKDNQCVSVHIRRGDYLNHPLYEGICGLSYYNEAIEIIKKRVDNPTFVVFSNDIDWCRHNLSIDNPTYFVDWNKGPNSYVDMALMSICQHNIIANSSFSWWGAWLNSNPGKIVIAPRKWDNDKSHVNPSKSTWILL